MFKDKRVAVGLFGIHYISCLNHWMGWKHGVDYSQCYLNNKENIFEKFDTTFYSSTYFSDKIENLIFDYKFRLLKLRLIDNI